jgi:hypothetical protein
MHYIFIFLQFQQLQIIFNPYFSCKQNSKEPPPKNGDNIVSKMLKSKSFFKILSNTFLALVLPPGYLKGDMFLGNLFDMNILYNFIHSFLYFFFKNEYINL